MKTRLRCLAGAIVAGAVLAVAAQAGAATATLQLKRLETAGRPGIITTGSSLERICRMTYPQSFFMRISEEAEKPREKRIGEEREKVFSSPQNPFAEAFARAVRIEPKKYQSKHPFRSVAKLAGKEYGFVLDAKDAKSGGYDRLWFDFNHNGDLTDDKPVDALKARGGYPISMSYRYHTFPRVDVTLTVDGKKLDYSFFLSVYSMTSGKTGYVSASLNAAAYREGQITLGGKTRHLILLDYNSNGSFNDEFKVRGDIRTPDGVVYPEQGDVLMVDPDPAVSGRFYYFDIIGDPARQLVSKLVSIDGRFYDLTVSATGKKLTLEPSSVPLGHLTSPSEGFRAAIYGEQGFLKIVAEKKKPIPVPAGEWKLVSYTIDRTGYKEPAAKPAGKEGKKVEKKRSLLEAIGEALTGSSSSRSASPFASGAPRQTLVSAQATSQCKAFRVAKGQTVALGFGPPYKPVVKAAGRMGADKVSLSLSLVGAGGERCTDLKVNGGRPGSPEFVITTPDGKEVQHGKFSYGWGFTCRYSWRVPSEPAKQYHVRVSMKAGPFKVDDSYQSVIRLPQPPAGKGR